MAYINRPYPRIPEHHYPNRLRLEFHHWYQPALALGGDFFDIMELAPDTAGVFIADVMGHGARSALITAILRTILRESKSQGRNAPHFMTEVNRSLCEIMSSFPQPLFASAYYFVPDVTSRMATFSAAGHPPPFHLHRPLNRITRLSSAGAHGAALGILPEETYGGGHVRLQDGDTFLLFTDGLYEASNHLGEEFGLSRLQEILRAHMHAPTSQLLDELRKALFAFTGDTPLVDDICVVTVTVTTKPVPEPQP
jgi:serine phosphatase RsbU (regulator of sigma subunit)